MLLIVAIVVLYLAGPSWWTVLLVVLAAFAEIGEFMLGLHFTRRRRERRLIGRTGWMKEGGIADIKGELWPAAGAAPGEPVEVVAVEGRALRVRPREEAGN